MEENEQKAKQSRRGKGEGSIYQRPDGIWCARIDVGRDANGKRRRKAFYGPTKKSVANKLTKEAAAQLTGSAVDCGNMTLTAMVTKWLDELVKPNQAPGTYANYKRLADNYILPRLGGVKLRSVQPLHVQSLLSALEKEGTGARTREYCYVTLHRAFKVAIKWRLLTFNPCDGVDAPTVRKRAVRPLTAKQARALLKASKSDRFHAAYVLALTTGLRQGELLALHWEDVDLKAKLIHVRYSLEDLNGKLRLKEPKTEASKRQVAMPKIAVEALIQHRAALLREGLAGCPYVFPNADGGLLRKCSFYRWSWAKVRTAAKLDSGVHFHDLRHSAASLMLDADVNMKSIQTVMGHSNISMTMDTYAHLMTDAQRKAAGIFDRLKLG